MNLRETSKNERFRKKLDPYFPKDRAFFRKFSIPTF
jgi:hypothetical protein